jgi:hypothetical protein
MPNAISRFFMGLIGKTWVHDSADGVREALSQNAFNKVRGRAACHAAGAEKLTDSYAFQPGLIDLHDELHDTYFYLDALSFHAHCLGNSDLAEHLAQAARATCRVLKTVADAAEATAAGTPAPSK